MSKVRPPYPAEFRQQMVELVRAGRSPAQLSREFGVTVQSITNWVGQAATQGHTGLLSFCFDRHGFDVRLLRGLPPAEAEANYWRQLANSDTSTEVST